MNFKIILSILLTITVAAASDLDYQTRHSRLKTADSLYFIQSYREALPLYEQLLEDKHDSDIQFKIGVCNYHQMHYYFSLKIFNDLKAESFPLPEYLDYFVCLISLKIDHKEKSLQQVDKFLERYDNHFLSDSLRLRMADDMYRMGDYVGSYQYYESILRQNIKGRDRIHTMKQMALIKFYTGPKKEGMERMYQILKQYPSSDDALSIAKYMNYLHPDDDRFFFAIVDVFLRHRYFSVAKYKLEQYIGIDKNEEMIEKARYYLIRIYYLEGEYAPALYGYKNILPGLKNKTLDARIQLDIARCYLNLDQKENAIIAYYDYAEKYSRRRIASEAMWKAAWIYEELGDIAQALNLYKLLREKWPRSKFSYEAKFREGFSYYRVGQYEQALVILQEISRSQWSDLHKERAEYWISKIYLHSGREKEAEALQIKLGKRLFKTYYSAQCYWMHRSYIDSLLQTSWRLAIDDSPLTPSESSNQNERTFRVKKLLGNHYALQELDLLDIKPDSFSDWLDLANIYAGMEAYHKVFRIYDFIKNHYYSDFELFDKPYLFKELYPLWYREEITKYCSQRSLEESLILAIIRQESIFDREAKSSAEAYGLMQIIPPTARSLANDLSLIFANPRILFQAEYNINLGTLYVQQLLDQYNGQKELMLAAYNAGPHRVKRWKNLPASDEIDHFVENIEYDQTRNYVRYVMRNYWAYQLLSNYR
jgi:soluble lytic murein transglycosylase-like protein